MKTPIQEAIEKLTRHEPGHEPGLMEADQRGDYLRFIDVMEALAQASKTSEPVAPDDWNLVPNEVTDDMVVAFCEAWYSKVRCIDDPEMQDAYSDMLAAAPTPPIVARKDGTA